MLAGLQGELEGAFGIAAARSEEKPPEEARCFEHLRQLADDWDGDGAPRPNDEAIRRVHELEVSVKGRGFVLTEVDADVLGGVTAIVRAGNSGRSIACTFLNSGKSAIVWIDGDRVVHHSNISCEELEKAFVFLG
jgi:hypothetical protein